MAGIQPTPAEAWKRLKDGNRRFVEGSNEHPNQDTIRRTDLASGQFPLSLIHIWNSPQTQRHRRFRT